MHSQYRIISLLILSFAAAAHHIAFAQIAKLYPVDEAARDPSFFIFRARLLDAVQQRDTAFIISITSPSIRYSFGDNEGIEGFKRSWKLDSPESKFWGTMMRVLALGGSFDGPSRFMAPYTYSNFPDQIDAFEHAVVVGENVRVRKQPDLDGPVIGTLSYDVVKVIDWDLGQEAAKKERWVVISLKDGSKGYIAEQYVRSSIDYRAIFEKKDGRWMMTVLVSGD